MVRGFGVEIRFRRVGGDLRGEWWEGQDVGAVEGGWGSAGEGGEGVWCCEEEG